jgi:hypothetical protein
MSDDQTDTVNGQATPSSTKDRPSWLRRLLWIEARVAEARDTTFGPGKPGFSWFDIARRLCNDVAEVGQTGKSSLAVLLLECDQVGLLVRAYLERAGLPSGAGPLGPADWANALQLSAVATALAKLTATDGSTLKALLGPDRDATLARLTGDDREPFASAVHDLSISLSEPLEFEAYRLWRAQFARWSRVAVAGVLLAAVLGVAGAWIDKKLGKPNLALHCPVTVSSQFAGEGTDHTLLVDGDRYNMGFHTESNGQQWVVIDLGSVRKFNKVVVYNRSDCCQDRAVPLKLQISRDNRNFTLLAERKETFEKWTAKDLHAEGRYLRLQNTPSNYFHLAEIEVY